MSRLFVAPHSASTSLDTDETGGFLSSYPAPPPPPPLQPPTAGRLLARARFAVTVTPAAASDAPVPVSAVGLFGQMRNRASGRGVADR